MEELDNPPSLIDDNIELVSSEALPYTRKRKKSIVWDHFTIVSVGDGCTRAFCNQCKKSFAYVTGSKVAGTSHLKRHIVLGICPESRHSNQSNGIKLLLTPGPAKRRSKPKTPLFPKTPLDPDRCAHEIVKMIIMHEYPLNIVEQSHFVDLVKALHPDFNGLTSSMVHEKCMAMYLREKQSLLKFLTGILGRASLTLDLWTSNQTLGFIFLTGHFIDSDWNFHRRVLNVITIPCPNSDDDISQAILTCLSDWNLEGKIFTLTVDNSFMKNAMVGKLRGFLSAKNSLMLNGQLLIRRCYARVLSQLARDAIGSMSDMVLKIRESIKYVKTSATTEIKFIELKHRLKVPSMKNLCIDDLTRWDTTYHMLIAAYELKEVFSCLDTSDPDYKIAPSMQDWRLVDILCTYMKIFFDGSKVLTSPKYPLASAFFPEVSRIQLELMLGGQSLDPVVFNLTKPLQEQFDKYWKDSCIVLAIAVVMDPRYKMKLVEFTFSKMYGVDADLWIKIVDDGIHELFLDYMLQSLPLLETFAVERNNEVSPKIVDSPQEEEVVPDFDIYISEISCSQETKAELDQYLEEAVVSCQGEEFDVLGWWRMNEGKFPTLSKMASDILSIPVSTVDPDSVYETEIQKMSGYRSSLKGGMLEALICTKDWLQYVPLSAVAEVPNSSVKMEF